MFVQWFTLYKEIRSLKKQIKDQTPTHKTSEEITADEKKGRTGKMFIVVDPQKLEGITDKFYTLTTSKYQDITPKTFFQKTKDRVGNFIFQKTLNHTWRDIVHLQQRFASDTAKSEQNRFQHKDYFENSFKEEDVKMPKDFLAFGSTEYYSTRSAPGEHQVPQFETKAKEIQDQLDIINKRSLKEGQDFQLNEKLLQKEEDGKEATVVPTVLPGRMQIDEKKIAEQRKHLYQAFVSSQSGVESQEKPKTKTEADGSYLSALQGEIGVEQGAIMLATEQTNQQQQQQSIKVATDKKQSAANETQMLTQTQLTIADANDTPAWPFEEVTKQYVKIAQMFKNNDLAKRIQRAGDAYTQAYEAERAYEAPFSGLYGQQWTDETRAIQKANKNETEKAAREAREAYHALDRMMFSKKFQKNDENNHLFSSQTTTPFSYLALKAIVSGTFGQTEARVQENIDKAIAEGALSFPPHDPNKPWRALNYSAEKLCKTTDDVLNYYFTQYAKTLGKEWLKDTKSVEISIAAGVYEKLNFQLKLSDISVIGNIGFAENLVSQNVSFADFYKQQLSFLTILYGPKYAEVFHEKIQRLSESLSTEDFKLLCTELICKHNMRINKINSALDVLLQPNLKGHEREFLDFFLGTGKSDALSYPKFMQNVGGAAQKLEDPNAIDYTNKKAKRVLFNFYDESDEKAKDFFFQSDNAHAAYFAYLNQKPLVQAIVDAKQKRENELGGGNNYFELLRQEYELKCKIDFLNKFCQAELKAITQRCEAMGFSIDDQRTLMEKIIPEVLANLKDDALGGKTGRYRDYHSGFHTEGDSYGHFVPGPRFIGDLKEQVTTVLEKFSEEALITQTFNDPWMQENFSKCMDDAHISIGVEEMRRILTAINEMKISDDAKNVIKVDIFINFTHEDINISLTDAFLQRLAEHNIDKPQDVKTVVHDRGKNQSYASDFSFVIKKFSEFESMKGLLQDFTGSKTDQDAKFVEIRTKIAQKKPLSKEEALVYLCMLELHFSGNDIRENQVELILKQFDDPSKTQLPTGEGKTLCIRVLALMKKLTDPDAKVDILTNTDNTRDEGYAAFEQYAAFLGYTATKISPDAMDDSADFRFGTYFNAAQVFANRKDKGDRAYMDDLAKRELVMDEADLAIDINANYSVVTAGVQKSMPEIARSEIKFDYAKFYQAFIEVSAKQRTSGGTADLLMELYDKVVAKLGNDASTNHLLVNISDEQKKQLIKACFSAHELKSGRDYIVDQNVTRSVVYMVDKKQTGAIDLTSRRANFVDQFLSAKEFLTNDKIVFYEPVTIKDRVIISDVTRCYKFVSMLTATFGGKAEVAHLDKFLPEAQKKDEPMVEIKPYKESRRVEVAAAIIPDDQVFEYAKREAELAVINGRSIVIFVDAIEDCEALAKYFKDYSGLLKDHANDIDTFDDKHKLNPNIDAKALIQKASAKGHILIATRAIARGTDLPQIDIGLDLCPDATRADEQKQGRIGRNGSFGIVKTVITESMSKLMGYKPLVREIKRETQQILSKEGGLLSRLKNRYKPKSTPEVSSPAVGTGGDVVFDVIDAYGSELQAEVANTDQKVEKKKPFLLFSKDPSLAANPEVQKRQACYKGRDEQTLASSSANIEIQKSLARLEKIFKAEPQETNKENVPAVEEKQAADPQYLKYVDAVLTGRLKITDQDTQEKVEQSFAALTKAPKM